MISLRLVGAWVMVNGTMDRRTALSGEVEWCYGLANYVRRGIALQMPLQTFVIFADDGDSASNPSRWDDLAQSSFRRAASSVIG